MKRLIPVMTALLLLASTTAKAQLQNLVSNGSFDDTLNCGHGIESIAGWYEFTDLVEYFNGCAMWNGYTNPWGYQAPLHGIGYISVMTQQKTLATSVGATRSRMLPMKIGGMYLVHMYVSLADYSKYASANLDVFFFDEGDTTNYHDWKVDTTFPQVKFESYGIVTDTQNWVHMVDTFIADSVYDNIVIGAFLEDMDLLLVNSSGIREATYYIDSIAVMAMITNKSYDSVYCAGDSTYINYIAPDIHTATNVFTAQLSDKNGNFSSPIDIGALTSDTSGIIGCKIPSNIPPGEGYKIRIVSSSPVDASFATEYDISIGNLDSANIQVSSNSPLCVGDTLKLATSANVTYVTNEWNGPYSFYATTANPFIPNVTLQNSGSYYSITKNHGCVQYDTLEVVVSSVPITPVASSNTPLCASKPLELSSTNSSAGVTYSWTGPNNYSSSSQNSSIPYSTVNNSGVYTVHANNNGCVRSSSTNVTVLAAPENTVANSNTPLCVGETLNLTATNNTSGVSYSWTGPNSYSSNSQNPSITNTTIAQSGAYIATYSLNGCVEKDTVNVAVNIVPAKPAVNYNTPLCVGETLNLTGTSTTSGVSYSWTGPNSFSSNSQNPTKNSVSVSDTGTYTLITTRLNCTSSPASIKVDVRPTPFVVMYTNDDSICKDETVTFNSLANNASGNVQYQWYINAQAISGATQTTYTTSQLNDGDVVYCNMIDNTSCSVPFTDESNDIQITVLPWLAPSVSISVSPQGPIRQDSLMTFTATAVDAGVPIYQWKRNGQDVQGATGQTWAARTLNNNDVICVEIESGYRCPSPLTVSSNCITAEVVSVDNISNISSLKLYPNPNAGQFVLEGKVTRAANYNIQIVNTVGQVVYKTDVATRSGSLYKSMQVNLAAGVYLLQLQETSTKQTQTMRLVIE